MDEKPDPAAVSQVEAEKREANTCIALGAGVGALGAGAAIFSGAVCPVCVIVAPGLIGAGVLKRWILNKRGKSYERGE